MRIMATGFALFAMAGSGFAATLKVPQQYETIQAAVNAAEDGDTIKIAPGVYNEAVYMEGKSNLKFVGSKGTIWESITEGYTTCLELYGSGFQVKGIRFRNCYRGIYVSGSGNTVTGCTFVNTWEDSVRSNGDDFVFTKNVVQDTYRGVRAYGGSRANIVKNTFRRNYDNTVDVQGSDGLVTGNTIFGHYADGNVIYVSGAGMVVTKNRVRNCYGTQIYATGSGALISGNTLGNGYGGIYVTGTASTIEGNRINTTYYYGIYAVGNGHAVSGNDVGISYYSAIRVDGIGNTISGNRCHDVTSDLGIDSDGNGAIVEGNTVFGTYSTGIDVSGSGLTVRGNTVSEAWDSHGIRVSGAGINVVEDNTVEDCVDAGINVDGGTGVVTGNTITNCGTYYESALQIFGSNYVLEGNRVSDAGTNGIFISGTGNDLVNCVVVRAAVNGFFISGTDNTLDDCSATDGDGQGFLNQGTNTTVTGSTFLRNALDVANSGTLANGTSGMTFETGSAGQPPIYFTYPD